MPVNIDGSPATEITIDGAVVQQITMDGNVVYDASGSTTTPTVIEDWDSSNPLTDWNGETGECTISTSVYQSGGQALVMGGSWMTTIWASSADLNAVPSQGDRFEYYIRHETASSQCDAWTEFARQDSNNYYSIYTDANANSFKIRKTSAGTDTVLAETPFTYSANTWYKVEVEWDDGATFGGVAGDITARIYEGSNTTTTISGNDTSWTTGDVQIRADKSSSGNRIWHDSWKITN